QQRLSMSFSLRERQSCHIGLFRQACRCCTAKELVSGILAHPSSTSLICLSHSEKDVFASSGFLIRHPQTNPVGPHGDRAGGAKALCSRRSDAFGQRGLSMEGVCNDRR